MFAEMQIQSHQTHSLCAVHDDRLDDIVEMLMKSMFGRLGRGQIRRHQLCFAHGLIASKMCCRGQHGAATNML